MEFRLDFLSKAGVGRFKLCDAVFYSDSINDLPLLQKVATPVAVDPDQRLRDKAESEGWEILTLRS